MAKTMFTEKRVESLQRSADFELWVVAQKIGANIKRFDDGEQTANRTIKTHRTLVERFDRLLRIEKMIVDAANRMDECEGCDERHYVSVEYVNACQAYLNHCAYFEK
jgi:hypothetical protein